MKRYTEIGIIITLLAYSAYSEYRWRTHIEEFSHVAQDAEWSVCKLFPTHCEPKGK